jgi:hypothetical protein
MEPEELENECAWCGAPCIKDFCSEECITSWVRD